LPKLSGSLRVNSRTNWNNCIKIVMFTSLGFALSLSVELFGIS
jgi:hypothetical protein